MTRGCGRTPRCECICYDQRGLIGNFQWRILDFTSTQCPWNCLKSLRCSSPISFSPVYSKWTSDYCILWFRNKLEHFGKFRRSSHYSKATWDTRWYFGTCSYTLPTKLYGVFIPHLLRPPSILSLSSWFKSYRHRVDLLRWHRICESVDRWKRWLANMSLGFPFW